MKQKESQKHGMITGMLFTILLERLIIAHMIPLIKISNGAIQEDKDQIVFEKDKQKCC